MSSISFPERPDCPFCSGLADHSLDIVAETPEAVAFLDSFPLNPGHTLIIPRRHVADEDDLTAGEREAIYIELLPQARRWLEGQGYQADGFNIGVNIGSAAGQTVGHVHIHLIPRLDGDVRYGESDDPRGGIRWVIPDRAAYWQETHE